MMVVYGSGMAGLLAANRLRRLRPLVYESQPSLPNGHHALLRFRTGVCSEATGIPFKKVTVNKAVCIGGQLLDRVTLAHNNMYSAKVTGQVSGRSILNLEAVERYIAPPDFISQMAASVPIEYSRTLSAEDLIKRTPESDPVISTIPMPAMIEMVGWQQDPGFSFRTIWTINLQLPNCEVYQTIYYPEAAKPQYRASITGGKLTIECSLSPENPGSVVKEVLGDFGIQARYESMTLYTREQKYGKLAPLSNPEAARSFILYLTERYRIYSLGRFATWRQLLLDSVVHDIGVIERLIECRDGYSRALGAMEKAK